MAQSKELQVVSKSEINEKIKFIHVFLERRGCIDHKLVPRKYSKVTNNYYL